MTNNGILIANTPRMKLCLSNSTQMPYSIDSMPFSINPNIIPTQPSLIQIDPKKKDNLGTKKLQNFPSQIYLSPGRIVKILFNHLSLKIRIIIDTFIATTILTFHETSTLPVFYFPRDLHTTGVLLSTIPPLSPELPFSTIPSQPNILISNRMSWWDQSNVMPNPHTIYPS